MARRIACFLVLTAAAVALADESQWEIAWKDDFDRKSTGDDWEDDPQASIEDGWLHLEDFVFFECKRSFGPDVMVVFIARADPDRPPCDLSVRLGKTYLFGFGAGNNQFNHIVGGDVTVRDYDPEILIEPGEVYKLVAVKEGPRLAYYCNDKLLVETTTDDPVGGAGFDQLEFVTWHGMYIDYVHVFERKTPAPGGPKNLDKMPELGFDWSDRKLTYTGDTPLGDDVREGIRLFNDRRYEDAHSVLRSVEPPTIESVAALAYVVGDIAFTEKPADQQEVADLAGALADSKGASQDVKDFALAARWFAMFNHRYRNHRSTLRLMALGPENNPFYYKAWMFETRFNMAHAQEGGLLDRMNEQVNEFKKLKEIWPEVEVLRVWTGEQIPWGEDLIHDESEGPAWARSLQETFARQTRILEWWFNVRQAPDGSLGGGWGDDVELLRTWVMVAAITSANESVIAGIERLADGVWEEVLVDGYDNAPADVEHTAEPSADSMPTMLLLRYGDPFWIERNLRSARTIREKFMGVNERGRLQFKSSEFGTRKTNIGLGHGGDTGYCARAAKHFIWLAWYGIDEARRTYLDWCETWREATMARIGTKPPGIVPPSIWWPDGGIYPPNGAPWYDDEANYYGYPGLPMMVHESLLTACQLTGERKWLDPFQTMMEISTIGPRRRFNADKPLDDIDNIREITQHWSSRDLTATYRWLTDDRTWDEYTLRNATIADQYAITHDFGAYANAFHGPAQSMRTNWLRHTKEILQTDRAGLYTAFDVFYAYTGGVTSYRDSKAITQAVTYDTPNIDFAAVVTENRPDRLRILVYSFNDGPMKMGVKPWRLLPGRYVLNMGEPVAGEKPVQKRYTWGEAEELMHLRKGEPIWVDVPSHKEWVIDLRLREEVQRPESQPDVAVGRGDVQLSDDAVEVTVHNIGNAPAPAFDVALQKRQGDRWQDVARVNAGPMAETEAFVPVRQNVIIPLPEGAEVEDLRVMLDPDGRIDELYELNNARPVLAENAR